MQFVVAIERGGEDQAYGVVVPDLPGCFSAGDSFGEALTNVREAIVMHLEALGAEGIEVVVPQGVDAHIGKPEFKGWVWGFVDVDDRLLSDKAERINITVPSRKLRIIDRAASIAGKARSEYLVENAVARAMDVLRPGELPSEVQEVKIPGYLSGAAGKHARRLRSPRATSPGHFVEPSKSSRAKGRPSAKGRRK